MLAGWVTRKWLPLLLCTVVLPGLIVALAKIFSIIFL
jgi:hypothetical protein